MKRMAIDLFNNRTPKKTTVITGSRLVDTRVVASGLYMYAGSEMVPTLSRMTDHHGNAAFVGVEHYAYSGVAGVKFKATEKVLPIVLSSTSRALI